MTQCARVRRTPVPYFIFTSGPFMTCIALLIHTFDVGLIAPDKRMCVRRNPWATAHLGHLELRSTCELTRLAQRGRRATAMARTSPATQGSTIMAPRGVLQPLGYGSIPGAPGATELRSTIARHEVRQPSKYPRSCRSAVCRNPWATEPLGAHALFFPWRHSCDAPLV